MVCVDVLVFDAYLEHPFGQFVRNLMALMFLVRFEQMNCYASRQWDHRLIVLVQARNQASSRRDPIPSDRPRRLYSNLSANIHARATPCTRALFDEYLTSFAKKSLSH
jgi:hypothetical protein